MTIRQQLLAFGFNAFAQCADVVESPASSATATTPAPPLTTQAVVSLAQAAEGDPFVGIAATFSCSIAWTATEIHIYGCTSLFTGGFEAGNSSASHVAVTFAPEAGDIKRTGIKKVVPARLSPKDEHERSLLVLLNDHTLYVLAPAVRASTDPSSLKRKRSLEQSQGVERMTLRTTLPTSFVVPIPCMDVAASSSHGAAVTIGGELITWELGTTAISTINRSCMPSSPSFAAISAGRLHFLALSRQKEVYTWGTSGLNGQLGHGFSESVPKATPEVVEALQGLKVSGVAGGGWHSAVVTADGDVYTFGSGLQGQLGRDDDEDDDDNDDDDKDKGDDAKAAAPNHALPGPVTFDFTSQELTAACGSQHTVVSDGNRVYACGWNKYGQVTPSSSSAAYHRIGAFQTVLLPAEVMSTVNAKVKAISCGAWHTLVLMEWEEKSSGG
ncbi:RCC1 domain-containing protein 1 [Geranomyces michiganensis]|nr:RCC1 domain-containing protein 1 [Geranomyces michiganensis]